MRLGTTRGDVRRKRLGADRGLLPVTPTDLPRNGTLGLELAMTPHDRFIRAAKKVLVDVAAGRIAAETVAPAPPTIPRLTPGQRIAAEHGRFRASNRRAGMFPLDPADPFAQLIRVVKGSG